MNLFDYFCKNVVLQDCDGTVWHGYVDTFIPAIDSEDEEDEISLITNKGYICFHESEIRSIRFDRKKETKK
mgnify:FL=1|jgi:hypothetical protein